MVKILQQEFVELEILQKKHLLISILCGLMQNQIAKRVTSSHVTLVVLCVTILATEAACGGTILHLYGYQSGAGLVFLTLNTAISGLIGFLGGRGSMQMEIPTMLPQAETTKPKTK